MHSNSGRPQSEEHKLKLSLSNKTTRAAWSPEKKEEMRIKNSLGHLGQSPWNKGKKRPDYKPWNKGNNWRSNLSVEEIKKIINERMRAYREKNPKVIVNDRMTRAVHRALRGEKANRSWESILGYTCEDLYDHLESLFLPGMTWENMGEWHIDHILPRASFDYESEHDDSFKECWKLSNLQPLWAVDNMKKGSKILS